MSKKKSVAIVITHEAFAVNKILLAKGCENLFDGDYQLIVFSFVKKERLLEILSERNIKHPKRIEFINSDKSFIVKLLERLKNKISFIPHIKIYLLPAIISELIFSVTIIRRVRYQFRKFKTRAVILSETSPDYYAPEIVAASRGLAKVFTLPYERMEPDDYAMIYKGSSLQIRDKTDYWISKIFPNWKWRFQECDILRTSVEKLVSQEMMRVASSKPWETFGYLEDHILSTSSILRKYLIEINGVSESKIHLTGSPQHDILFQYKNNEEFRSERLKFIDNQFNQKKPYILCALPQTHWIGGRDEAEFNSHEEMLNVWIDTLSDQSSYNIILSLHPSMSKDKFSYLERDNAKIVDQNIIELIPHSEIFVACLTTVIQYAIAWGIPVINYDVYRYSLDLSKYTYKDAKGVITVTNREDFKTEFNKITSKNEHYLKLKENQKSVAMEWGIIDGKSAMRIQSVIKELT